MNIKNIWPRGWIQAGSLCLLLLACQGKPDSVPAVEPKADQGERPVQIQIPEDTLISLERSACYGKCPIYEVSVNALGESRFVGRDHVASFGEREGQLSKSALRRLLREFEEIGFFDLEDEYYSRAVCDEMWTDNPTVKIKLRRDGQSKTVTHNLGCRGFDKEDALIRLEEIIDDTTGATLWVGAPQDRTSKLQSLQDHAERAREQGGPR